MAEAAKPAKGTKKAEGETPFFIPEFDGMNVMARFGRVVLREGTHFGLGGIAAMPSVSGGGFGKWLPWITTIVGIGGEVILNESGSNIAVAVSGIAQGLTGFGTRQLMAKALGTSAAKFGLAGLAANASNDTDEEINWFDLSSQYAAATGGPANDSPSATSGNMAGLDVTNAILKG